MIVAVRLFSRWAITNLALVIAFTLALAPQISIAEDATDALLTQAASELSISPEAARLKLELLGKLEARMSALQRGKFSKLRASSFAFRGMYKEQVEISKEALKSIIDLDQRASLLYYLADGYANLGEYENALQAMNDAIQILPKTTDIESKVEVIQSAYSLFQSLGAYDEATAYAERLVSMSSGNSPLPACVGLADLIELGFLRHDSVRARGFLADESKACENGGYKIIELSMEALNEADRLGANGDAKVLANSVALLSELTKGSERSDYSHSIGRRNCQKISGKRSGNRCRAICNTCHSMG